MSAAPSETAAALRSGIDRMLAERDRSSAIRAALAAVRDGRVGVLELYDDVLTPLLVETGSAWQAGTTQVWEEHFASATVRTIIEALAPDVLDAAEKAPRLGLAVLLACPPQEQHDLGLRMLADRFALAGWDVTYLGTDTPVAEIAAAARALNVSLVVLSASTHFNRVHLRRVVDTIKASIPGVRVAVGGPAFALDRSWRADELFSLDEITNPVLPGAPVGASAQAVAADAADEDA